MSQPNWRCVANLGDVNPIEYGGLFVFIDETGVYSPEMELVELIDDDDGDMWEIRRVCLDKCTYSGAAEPILSDNKFHPDHPAWFAKPESARADRPQDSTYLRNVCDCMDVERDELIAMLCSDDAIERAEGYRCIYEYHGWENGDSYPLQFTDRAEVEARYAPALAQLDK